MVYTGQAHRRADVELQRRMIEESTGASHRLRLRLLVATRVIAALTAAALTAAALF
jgi:hypothetical protein